MNNVNNRVDERIRKTLNEQSSHYQKVKFEVHELYSFHAYMWRNRIKYILNCEFFFMPLKKVHFQHKSGRPASKQHNRRSVKGYTNWRNQMIELWTNYKEWKNRQTNESVQSETVQWEKQTYGIDVWQEMIRTMGEQHRLHMKSMKTIKGFRWDNNERKNGSNKKFGMEDRRQMPFEQINHQKIQLVKLQKYKVTKVQG